MNAIITWLYQHPLFVACVSMEILGAFTVTSIEIVPDDRVLGGRRREYPLLTSWVHGLFWPIIIVTWFLQEKGEKRLRLLRFVWAFVITGWSWALLAFWIYRQGWKHGDLIFLSSMWSVMSFLTYTVEVKPVKEFGLKDSPNEPLSTGWTLFIRTLLWFTAIPRWFRTGDDSIVIRYTRNIWAVLITGWTWALLKNMILIWILMSFITYCIERMPNKVLSSGWRLWRRTLLWFTAIPRWFYKEKDRVLAEYTFFMWVPLILGWLWGIVDDESNHMVQIVWRMLQP